MKAVVASFSIICALVFSSQAQKNNPFTGTWCVESDGLQLTFSNKDTIEVVSLTDPDTKSKGTYEKTDSTFLTTITSNDITMKMKYRFKLKNQNIIDAQAVFFTANDDTVESPKEWKTMVRCKGIGSKEPAKTPDATKKSDAKSTLK
jgi:hypothetical protein